jgi:tRNA (cytidine56-2'-O)-methyltransferase
MVIYVFRLGHRISRDKRISTHCGLVSRAFNARGMLYSGERDSSLEKSVRNVVKSWGGPFEVKHVKNQGKFIQDFNGTKVHLTMYGLPMQSKITGIRKSRKDLLVIVGGEKVPGDVYHMSDFNLAVSSQPHSEIAALAVFLHEFFNGKELEKNFQKAKRMIIPHERGKKVVQS